MPIDTVPGFLQLLLMIFGGSLCAFIIAGFWRGLSLRPHEREHRPAPPPFWWYTGL